MKITVGKAAFPGRGNTNNAVFQIRHQDTDEIQLEFKDATAYPTFTNCHDHLIGNWYPKAGAHRPYINSHIWVEDMKSADSVLERNKIWLNDGSFDLLSGNAPLLAKLGAYKNLFSGCTIVQDHGPNQKDAYYDLFPIDVIRKYRQCHSLTLGNWWGGLTPFEEWSLTDSKIPFIIHLGEGFDDNTRDEFAKLMEMGILQPNTIIVHGVSLTKYEIRQCAEVGTSICWCPSSNFYLLDHTLDIETCLDYGVNVVIGTDSSLSGSVNMFDELHFIHKKFPFIPMKNLLEMITVNAVKALLLPDEDDSSLDDSNSLLICDSLNDDPYQNLAFLEPNNIQFMIHKGKPLYGDTTYLNHFHVNESEYSFFAVNDRNKFVIGDPLKLNQDVDSILGYHKDFPYFPF
ncbi:MAG TPA: amidohydrolase family protein [Candidatus Cloacimonadota bacterium]|nr:amidohydrolase family protein [Candidatus Cloacimonadota bacterium]